MNVLLIVVAVALIAVSVLAVLWFYSNKKKRQAGGAGGTAATGGDEIGLLIRDANARLASSNAAKGVRIGSSPVILVLGESGSAKTSVMLQSGLEPELLAGQIYQEGLVAPTRTANLWYSRNVVFVEAGGGLVPDGKALGRLAAKLKPSAAALTRGEEPGRAVVVCFDCDAFNRAGAHQAVAESARQLRAGLTEIAQTMGVSLPTYVLFTKMDRLPHFTDYFRNLTNEETGQALGFTLPLAAAQVEGVYAEQQTARLTGEFERLFGSLASWRLEYLSRETDASRLPAVYEFPREFRKIRPLAVQFLVDLCRPSQLSVGPFLRGAYFTGVRPIIINDASPVVSAPTPSSGHRAESAATTLFRPGMMEPAPAPAPQAFARKVPQWLFLGHVFNDVLLADQAAIRAGGDSAGRSFKRRLLFASAAALCGLLSIAFTVSFVRNRSLETQVREESRAIAAVDTPAGAATMDSLRHLDRLREAVATMIEYQRDGAPWSYRWGLYAGNAMLPEAQRLYFDRFRALLLAPTQGEILRSLRGLPSSNGPEYGPTYDALKAYIITTSHPEKSTVAFLPAQLQKWWGESRGVETERLQLARRQFDFYAGVLPAGNPYPGGGDEAAIAHARAYLAQFADLERVYAFMLAETSKGIPAVNFNRQYPGSAGVVVESHEVPGAFSKNGWAAMKDALAHADRYVFGEQWVLGDRGAANLDLAKLTQDLRARYYSDFVKEWRAYIKSATVVRYAGLKDASQKLIQLSGNQSPLLELLSLAAQHTAVDDAATAAVFQPVQTVTPPGSNDRFIGPTNQNYINALVALQSSLEAIAGQPGEPSDAAAAPTLTNAGQAKINARQMAQAFRIDAEGHIDAGVEKLLEDPITNAESLLRRLGPAELNGKGKALCADFQTVMSKYPFNPNAASEARLDEVDGLFRKPAGALWSFYEQSLQKLLTKQGAQYVPASGSPVTLTPEFVAFFNTAAAFAESLYAGGTADPHFTFTLTPEPGEGTIQNLTVTLDGDTLIYTGGKATPKPFTWQGAGAHQTRATLKFGNGPDLTWSSTEGLWAVFRFFAKAERSQSAGNNEVLEWVIRMGKEPVTLPNGKPLDGPADAGHEWRPTHFRPRVFGAHELCFGGRQAVAIRWAGRNPARRKASL